MCLGQNQFPMATVTDEEGNLWHDSAKRQHRLNHGVRGAHVCMPYQCERCWFINLENREPGPGDEFFMRCLRRANLDAMAGKSHHTIAGHRNRTMEMVRNCGLANKTPSLEPRGPFPIADQVGMGLLVDILIKSVVADGRNAPHVQAETLRQLKATYTKNWDSSPAGVAEMASFSRGTGRVRPTACPSQSEYFLDAWRGLETRMGHQSRANHATTMEVMVKLLMFLKAAAEAASSVEEANELWKAGAFICLLTAGSLRGYEGFYADLAGLRRYLCTGVNGIVPARRINKNTILSDQECRNLPHVVIPLIGKFKGEHIVDHHLINVANTTQSGLETRWWVEKLVSVCEEEDRFDGPAFATPAGALASSPDYNAVFLKYMRQVQTDTDLIDKREIIEDRYGISRTPRRTAVTRAKRAGYTGEIDELNRWRTVENAKGRRVKLSMQMHYAEAVQMMPTTWRVSYSL